MDFWFASVFHGSGVRHGLVESSAQGLGKAVDKYDHLFFFFLLVDVGSYVLRVLFQAHVMLGRIPFLWL